ncbi:MAG TPA: DUF4097 family beta strand repeat-containing protein [Acidimicrobiia bacterium]|jgi:hypothetical protein
MTTTRTDGTGSGSIIRIVIGLVILVIGVTALLRVFSSASMEEATDIYTGVADLALDLRNGPVVVTAGDTDEVHVEKRYTTGLFGGSTSAEQRDDILTLSQRCPFIFGFGCRSEHHISVPVGTTVTGSTTNGSITIEGLEGVVDVTTSNGAIELDGVASTVSARTSNGAITGTGLLSTDLEVSTSNGRVRLDFTRPPTSVEVSTSNGEIEVTLPDDSSPYAVITSTSNGVVDVGIRTDPDAGQTIDLGTSNGDITVRYPG